MYFTPCLGLRASLLSHFVGDHAKLYTGLSLLGYPNLVDIDPVYCMPTDVIDRMGLRKEWEALSRAVDSSPHEE
jgi:hypothetical protein